MNLSFFESKIKEHVTTYPELLKSEWLCCKETERNFWHLEPVQCGYYSNTDYKAHTLTSAVITVKEILEGRKICKKCKKNALEQNGRMGSMLESQIKILETNSLPSMVEKFWEGRNRTITQEVHSKFWKITLKPKLEQNFTKGIGIYATTYGGLHHSKMDHSLYYGTIIENITKGYLHRSGKGGVWFYTKTQENFNQYETCLEQNNDLGGEKLVESLKNLSEFCDNALQRGGWEDLKYWWGISKRV